MPTTRKHLRRVLFALGLLLASGLLARPIALWLAGADGLTRATLNLIYGEPPKAPPSPSPTAIVTLSVDERASPVTLGEPLLGFAIDTSQVVGGHWWSPEAQVEVGRGSRRVRDFDFSRPRLRRLARPLAPARLRIGGTEADHVYYSQQPIPESELPGGYELVLHQGHWNAIADFVKAMGFSLLFTVNAGPGPRDEEGMWQAQNAVTLLEMARLNAPGEVVWELGNEVNAYWFIHGLRHQVSGSQYGRDFLQFRTLVHDFFPGARVAGPAGFLWPVLGEPMAERLGVFEDFLARVQERVDVVTWHYYPQQSRRCPAATRRAGPGVLLNPAFLDETGHWAEHIAQLRDRYAGGAQVWLGESGNAQCGGEPGVSNTFASSFWYLDQVGQTSLLGQVMIRQALVGAHYGLLEPESLRPLPDYWAALLLRRFASSRVLRLSKAGDNPYLRAYATCRGDIPAGRDDLPNVVVWLLNLHPETTARVRWQPAAELQYLRVTASALDSQVLSINQQPMELQGSVPPIWLTDAASEAPTLRLAAGATLELPPSSYSFALSHGPRRHCP